MITPELVKEAANEVFHSVLGFRQHLHQHPELSFQENQTADFIAQQLRQAGITEFNTGVAGTGIVGTITGGKPGPVLALRADIDALPIQEENEVDYKSQVPGVMHACGHDVHSACLFGALQIINRFKADLAGSVKFIFQPGEELLPGGASLMIAEGVLENPSVNHILGQHVFPELPAGKVGFRPGMYMASTDEIYITVTGKGGHGAMPHQTVDTILVAANIITQLQQVVSRRANPTVPTVLSFGRIEGLGATNVIPGTVKIEGTFRTFNEDWRNQAHQIIEHQIGTLAQSMGAEAHINIVRGYPALRNHEELTMQMNKAAKVFLGEDNVVALEMRTTAEDFAFYSQQIPACFYRLGVRNEEKGIVYGVHHPKFDIDPSALEVGSGLMAWLALQS
ncbi:MAG TPA: M20 family metallopeptidase [Luteibaculaceae bacterium]|nr:M20 family metallopeptidase [Luteibaculaceae bacterium]